MIIKNEIPILEYDDASPEVIAPDHDMEGIVLPEKCLFAFLGDVVHGYAADNNAEMVKELITVSHNIRVYVLHEENEDICLVQSPITGTLTPYFRKKEISISTRNLVTGKPERPRK